MYGTVESINKRIVFPWSLIDQMFTVEREDIYLAQLHGALYYRQHTSSIKTFVDYRASDNRSFRGGQRELFCKPSNSSKPAEQVTGFTYHHWYIELSAIKMQKKNFNSLVGVSAGGVRIEPEPRRIVIILPNTYHLPIRDDEDVKNLYI